jgi:hypothetical protein
VENKAGKMLNGIQNGLNLQLHRWSWVRWFAFLVIHKLNDVPRISDGFLPQNQLRRRCRLKRATGQACEPTARARLRSSVENQLTGIARLPTNSATDPKNLSS